MAHSLQWKINMRSPSTCHPDEPVCGGGLCRRCYTRKWKREHPDSPNQKLNKRLDYLKRVHNIDEEMYQQMYKSQDGCCAICSNRSKLFVDHNHKTKKIRGLLCNRCNLALGHVLDDPKILDRALQYLNKTDNLSTARFEYY